MIVASVVLFSQTVSCKSSLLGKPFEVKSVRVQKSSSPAYAKSGKVVDRADVYFIEFADSDKFIADRSVKLHFHVKEGADLANFRWSQKATKFGTEEHSKQIHGHTRGASCGRGAVGIFLNDAKFKKHEVASDMINFTISTRKAPGGGYQAQVRASHAELKTWVQGSFTFQIEQL